MPVAVSGQQTLDRLARLRRDRGPDGLACPVCGCTAHMVVDSRSRDGRNWRRRMCRNRHRFNTLETVEGTPAPARLAVLVALLDSLSPDDFVLVGRLAGRLARSP